MKESLSKNIIRFNKVSKEKENFSLINENVEIIDIPGIEDGIFSEPIKNFIMKHNEDIIPILIVNLAQGSIFGLN